MFQRIRQNQEAGTDLLRRFGLSTINAPSGVPVRSAMIYSPEITRSYNPDHASAEADPLVQSVAVLEMEVQKTRELVECQRYIA